MTSALFLRSSRLLLSAALCLAFSSCFGLGTVYVGQKEHPHFEVRQLPSQSYTSGRAIRDTKGARNPTREQVAATWGQPRHKRTSANEEIWNYPEDRMVFAGLIPMAGIGIPLVVPVGHESCDIHFAPGEGPALKAVENGFAQDGFAFQLISGEGKDDKAGFHRMNLSEDH
ncbi:MAG: hypothetical protein JWO82_181 [Akkermansiaceae bacterium]|nr:hypothetical protein [Akkermansiaceae bacterium]